MSFECIDIGDRILREVDDRTRRMLVVYANLQYELVALTGNIHTDEDVTLDRSELSEDERRQAESVARRMRGLRSVIAASHPELLQAYSLTQDSEG